MKTKLPDESIALWRSFLTAHARLVQAIEARFESSGVVPYQWYDVLVALVEAPEHRLRFSELAEKVLLSRSGLTRLVDRLVRAGLLVREDCVSDRRGCYARLTDAGYDAVRTAWPVYAESISRFFIQEVSEEDALRLKRLLDKILENLEAQTDL
jgi:DNA-binding MarR family transcriptional regulator